jgi:ketosteroid isomerase-like protein
MATASSKLAGPSKMRTVDAEPTFARNRRTVQAMVDGFAEQNIDRIMALIADDAVFCDILGKGARGDEYRGKNAIRKAFVRQFELAGKHSYTDARIVAEADCAFASWTMVIGHPTQYQPARFEGIDEFAFNAAGQIVLKKAWLKGQPRLRRTLLAHNPTALFRHLGYSLRSWGR